MLSTEQHGSSTPIRCVMLIFLLIANGTLYGQHKGGRIGKATDILKAEIEFASLARTAGVKAAFEKNLDSSGVIAVGNNIVNGFRAYAGAVPDTSELLAWQPLYAAVNKRNSFGFTTGPFLYYPKKGGKPTGSGYYFSIWEKDSNGQFKVKFDGGVLHNAPRSASFLKELPKASSRVLKPSSAKLPELSSVIGRLGSGSGLEGISFYKKFLSEDCVILRPDMSILYSAEDFLKSPIVNWDLEMVTIVKGSGMDDVKQLYYEYGNLAKFNDLRKKGTFCGYYVRIWQFQKTEWKIIADLKQFK